MLALKRDNFAHQLSVLLLINALQVDHYLQSSNYHGFIQRGSHFSPHSCWISFNYLRKKVDSRGVFLSIESWNVGAYVTEISSKESDQVYSRFISNKAKLQRNVHQNSGNATVGILAGNEEMLLHYMLRLPQCEGGKFQKKTQMPHLFFKANKRWGQLRRSISDWYPQSLDSRDPVTTDRCHCLSSKFSKAIRIYSLTTTPSSGKQTWTSSWRKSAFLMRVKFHRPSLRNPDALYALFTSVAFDERNNLINEFLIK